MIIPVEKLRKQITTPLSDDLVIAKLDAIESVIRAYTNNNFQIRGVRFEAHSEGNCLHGSPRYFTVGDTVQISMSGVNDGLYVVTEVYDDHIEINKDLFEAECLVTKVQYPADVVQCALDLFKWKETMGDKVGIKSETLSRHSVTYEDSATLYMGYPVGILNGLKLYRKVRC